MQVRPCGVADRSDLAYDLSALDGVALFKVDAGHVSVGGVPGGVDLSVVGHELLCMLDNYLSVALVNGLYLAVLYGINAVARASCAVLEGDIDAAVRSGDGAAVADICRGVPYLALSKREEERRAVRIGLCVDGISLEAGYRAVIGLSAGSHIKAIVIVGVGIECDLILAHQIVCADG